MQRVLALLVIILLGMAQMEAQSLKGSRFAMAEQFGWAKKMDLTRIKNRKRVYDFVEAGRLVKLKGNRDYAIGTVRYPVARTWMKTFVERLSSQRRPECGSEKLVVTSLTRPLDGQPRNASRFSVHPAGTAVDFRVPRGARCRAWLERTLISLEKRGVLQATRERHPPHYHVAVYGDRYRAYVASKSKPIRKTVSKPVRKNSAKTVHKSAPKKPAPKPTKKVPKKKTRRR